MSQRVRYSPLALTALEEIYSYTLETWSEAQADEYVSGAFTFCDGLADRPRRRIPEAFGVDGYFAVYQRHHIYWREAVNGDVVVVCILHSQRDLPHHVSTAFAEEDED